MFCSRCGNNLSSGTRFCSRCGAPAGAPAPAAPPAAHGYGSPYAAAPQRAAAAPAIEYAGFWRRVLASLIDTLILGVICVPLFFAFGLAGAAARLDRGQAIFFVLLLAFAAAAALGGWLYHALLESSARQATLGKMAIGLMVTGLDGSRLSFGRASGRHFAKIVTSLIPLGVGWMLAGWTARKQAIHDMLAATLVVRR